MTFIFKYFGSVKLRRKIYYFIINLINPFLILDVHWLSEPSKIHWHWDKLKGNRSKFIVIQHGVYTGGSISDKFDERHPQTSNFWVWSEYYKDQFSQIFQNKGKLVNIQVFGNTLYNAFNRNDFEYKEIHKIESILIAPTKLNDQQSFWYNKLIQYLTSQHCNVVLKFHNYQDLNLFDQVQNLISEDSLTNLLKHSSNNLVISDVSTVLLDSIFFKKPVIYFQPFELGDENSSILSNVYSENLNNYFLDFKEGNFDFNQIQEYIQLDAQEMIFSKLVYSGTNVITC